MITEILLRYVHFIALFVWIGALTSEHLLLKPQMSRAEIARLARIDAVYGLSAVLVVTAGLILWFGVGKPAEFYSSNWIFHTKVGLAVLVGLLSIYPTVFFIKNRKGQENEIIDIPNNIRLLIRVQLAIMLIIPLLATLMAKGIGI
jgi:putative membrane protein